MINFADWVEACVTAVTVVDRHEVRIVLERGGKRCSLRLEGVDRLVINEFRQQNVVEQIILWTSHSEPADYYPILAEIVSGVTGHGDVGNGLRQIIDDEASAIRAGAKVLMEIEPVYGAHVIALAKRVTMVEESST